MRTGLIHNKTTAKRGFHKRESPFFDYMGDYAKNLAASTELPQIVR